MSRSFRVLALLAALLLVGSDVVEARGGGRFGGGAGGGAGGAAKRSKKTTRSSAQVESLIQESFRRDALLRLRHTDW